MKIWDKFRDLMGDPTDQYLQFQNGNGVAPVLVAGPLVPNLTPALYVIIVADVGNGGLLLVGGVNTGPTNGLPIPAGRAISYSVPEFQSQAMRDAQGAMQIGMLPWIEGMPPEAHDAYVRKTGRNRRGRQLVINLMDIRIVGSIAGQAYRFQFVPPIL
jgi:hypothetical protein